MKNYLFARILRASGRLLLFAGAIFAFGLTLISIYLFFYNLNHPEQTVSPIKVTENVNVVTSLPQNDIFLSIVITVSSVVLACFLLWLVARIYNRNMRSIIGRLARLFKAQIFTVEVVSALLVWTIATLLLVFTIPFLSIVTIFAFIINELLFIFAWGAYGQPNYKI